MNRDNVVREKMGEVGKKKSWEVRDEERRGIVVR